MSKKVRGHCTGYAGALPWSAQFLPRRMQEIEAVPGFRCSEPVDNEVVSDKQADGTVASGSPVFGVTQWAVDGTCPWSRSMPDLARTEKTEGQLMSRTLDLEELSEKYGSRAAGGQPGGVPEEVGSTLEDSGSCSGGIAQVPEAEGDVGGGVKAAKGDGRRWRQMKSRVKVRDLQR
ncbi:hypothetical protein PENSPDRAFT_667051 [Peniophora sp. CONT]|nr:hypothetical protein PENSPDRAFT_667051 [Peniophora sp. CONT]